MKPDSIALIFGLLTMISLTWACAFVAFDMPQRSLACSAITYIFAKAFKLSLESEEGKV